MIIITIYQYHYQYNNIYQYHGIPLGQRHLFTHNSPPCRRGGGGRGAGGEGAADLPGALSDLDPAVQLRAVGPLNQRMGLREPRFHHKKWGDFRPNHGEKILKYGE